MTVSGRALIEWDTTAAAEALLAADAAAEAARRAAAVASPVRLAVEAPDDAPTVAERRRWALEAAIRQNPVIIKPGGGPPKVDYVYELADGTTKVVRVTKPQALEVIGPDGWEQHERVWAFRQRWRENELLAACYGVDELLASGIVEPYEVALMRLAEIEASPELRGLEGM